MIWRHIKIHREQGRQKLTRLWNDGSMDIFVHGSDFHQVSFPFASIGVLTGCRHEQNKSEEIWL